MKCIKIMILCLFYLSACGQESDEKKADIWDPDGVAYELQQGLYELEYSTKEDACSNSLADTANDPYWPPKYAVISTRRSAIVPIPYLRAQRKLGVFTSPMVDNRPMYRTLDSEDYSRQYIARCNEEGQSETAYDNHKFSIRSTNNNEITTDIRTKWNLVNLCKDMGGVEDIIDGFHQSEHIPLESCVDEYTITYRLKEACPDTCVASIQNKYVTDDLTGQEYYLHDTEKRSWCECPEE